MKKLGEQTNALPVIDGPSIVLRHAANSTELVDTSEMTRILQLICHLTVTIRFVGLVCWF